MARAARRRGSCLRRRARKRALDGLHGVKLTPVRAKPDFTLENTDGKPFHFAAETRGVVTLLFFGYTNCPDVCPQHLVNIAGALRQMSAKDQERVRVVFVTTDPARDTPERLRGWLNNFDRRFIGLRGGIDEVNSLQTSLGLPQSQMEAMPNMPAGPRPLTYERGTRGAGARLHAGRQSARRVSEWLHAR